MAIRLTHKGQMSEALRTAVFLSLSGGLLDAYTYLARDGVFANAETGNIVLLSVKLFQLDWVGALHYFIPILFFALGVPFSDVMRAACRNIVHLHWRQIVLAIEIAILFCVGFMPAELNILANSLVGLTCSMQVQAFRKVHGHPFASTMCTGNLRSGMDNFYNFLATHNKKSLIASLHYLGIIVLFGIGAGFGSVLVPALGFKTVWISCALLLVSFSLMFIEDEIEELAEEVEQLEEKVLKAAPSKDSASH